MITDDERAALLRALDEIEQAADGHEVTYAIGRALQTLTMLAWIRYGEGTPENMADATALREQIQPWFGVLRATLAEGG